MLMRPRLNRWVQAVLWMALTLAIGKYSCSAATNCTITASAGSILAGQQVTLTLQGHDDDGLLQYLNLDQVTPTNGSYPSDTGTEVPVTPDQSPTPYNLGSNYTDATRQVTLTLNQPGQYVFRAAASQDTSAWYYCDSNVTVEVTAPTLVWTSTPPSTVTSGTVLNWTVQADPNFELHFDYSTDGGQTWSPDKYVMPSDSMSAWPVTAGTAGTQYLMRAQLGHSGPPEDWLTVITNTVTVVKIDQPTIDVVNAQTIPPNTAWTPSFSGGAGRGAWQFDVAGQTAFPGTSGYSTGQTGTLLSGSLALSSTWTPTTEGPYYFRVRHLGDANYNDCDAHNPDPKNIPADFSGYYLLNVVALPTITGQPVSQSVSTGNTVTFSVVATDSTNNLSYQWQRDGVDLAEGAPYSGTTTSTLTITNAQTANAGSFTVVVKNSAGGTTSAAATLAFDGYSQNGTFYIDNVDYPAGVTQPPVDRSGTNENIVAALNAPVTVEGSATVEYLVAVGKQILLKPGFHAKSGSAFHAVANVAAGEGTSGDPPEAEDGTTRGPPDLSGGGTTATVGSGFSFLIGGSNATSYSATGLPPGISINSATGELYGTPTKAGIYLITINASNGSMSKVATVTLSVAAGDATSPGTLPGDVAVDNKGAANYDMSLEVPPGRAGMQPSLALDYSSEGGNGPLGIGFDLSTGFPHAITRGRSILARDGSVRGIQFDGTDNLYLDGKRLICVSGTSGQAGSTYRTEVDSFATITAFGTGSEIDGFRVDRKEGLMLCFGKKVRDANGNPIYDSSVQPDDAFQQAGGETTTQALTWALKWVEDRVGNYIEFRYDETDMNGVGGGELTLAPGEHLLTSIRYTGNRSQSIAPRYVVWLRHNDTGNASGFAKNFARPDARTSYTDGRATSLAARLDDVSVSEATGDFANPLRSYRLNYDSNVATPTLLRLAGVTRRDVGSALPSTQFTWGTAAPMLNVPDAGFKTTDEYSWTRQTFVGDFNGDGRKDVLFIHRDGSPTQTLTYAWRADDGTWQYKSSVVTAPAIAMPVTVGDFNGDGKTDVVWAIFGQPGNVNGWYVSLANGDGFGPLQKIADECDPGTLTTKVTPATAQAVDLDGDGCDELLFQVQYTYVNAYIPGINDIGDGGDSSDSFDLTGEERVSCTSVVADGPIHIVRPHFSNGVLVNADEKEVKGLNFGGASVALRGTDLDGDGKTDLIATRIDTSPAANTVQMAWTVTSYRNVGNDTFVACSQVAVNSANIYNMGDSGAYIALAGDINGDGLEDFVYLDHQSSQDGVDNPGWRVALSKGDGTFDLTSYAGVPESVTIDGKQYNTYIQKSGVLNTLEAESDGGPDGYYIDTLTGFDICGVALLDYNGDGRKDFVFYVKDVGWFCILAGTNGFDTAHPIALMQNPVDTSDYYYGNGDFAMDLMATDLSGSGREGLVLFRSPSIFYAGNQRSDTYRVVSVTDGLGATTGVKYDAITDDGIYTPGAPVAYPIRENRHAIVVSDVTRDLGGSADQQAHFSYQYSGRLLDLSGRGDLGFHSFITLDDQTQVFKYQFLTQSFPMTGLTAREQTYRYWTKDGATDFRLISSHDNTVVFDQVVKSAADSAAWGTLYPFISRAVESRWEDANTAHFSTTAGGATSQSELLFPNALPDGAHIQITAESLFDGQTEPQTTIPSNVGTATFYPSDLQNYAGTGLTGQYFDNVDLTGPAFTRVDSTIDFAWGTNVPDPRINPDTYSVRWTGHIVPRYDDQYTFTTTSDDGVRLWVNGQKLIDNWTDHSSATDHNAAPITLTGGHEYDIQLEYYQNTGDSVVQLAWQGLKKQSYEVVPQSQLYPTATYVASGTNAPAGVTSFSSIQSLRLPGNIYFGNLMSLKTDYGDGFSETVKTTYKTAPTDAPAMTGLVDTVNTDVTSQNYGTQSAPTKTYTYFGSTPLVSTEKISTGDTKLDTTTTYQRDDLGRVTETDISGFSAANDPQSIGQYSVSSTPAQDFDSRFDLPTTVKNADPYFHETKFQYDPTLGLPTSQTDVNSAETTTKYDVYGRPLAVTDVLKGLVTHTEYRWTSSAASDWTKMQTVSPPTVDNAIFNGVAASAPIIGVAGVSLNSAYVVKVTDTRATSYIPNKPTVWTYYDRLGRVIRTIKENFNGQTITDTAYNSLGQVIAVSNPYVAGATVYWTRTAYDALGRVATVTAPNGTVTTTTYQGRATITSVDAPNLGGIDPPAQGNATVVDAKGRTVKVWNPNPDTGAGPTFTDNLGDTATPPSIAFDLDGFGRVRTTTLKDQTQTITADYNALGQQIALNDPDKGNWTYLPNALGQVVQQTDAKQNVTTTKFDHLGRPLTRTIQEANSGPQQTDSWFYYDVAATATAHPELNLVEQGTQGWIGSSERQETSTTGASGYAAANSDAKTIHYYNSLGLPSIDLTWADDHWFYTFTTYDADLRVEGLDYFWREPGYDDPSQNPQAWEEFGVTYNYNPRGYVTSVADTNAAPRTWWQADPTNGYDYLDRPVLFRKGSGNWTQRTYRTTDGVLTAIATGTSPGGNDLQNLSYDYDGLGNLTKRTGAGGSELLTYDSLNRLTSSTKQGAYSYFPNGNIRNKAVVGSQTTPDYGYDPNHPHAVQTAFGYTMGYDANGNLSSRASGSETWDLRYAGFDKPRWMTKTTNGNVAGSEFLYDANHSRTVQLGYDQVDSAGVPSHYAWKRVYGLGPTLEANYQNDNNATGAPTWTLKKIRVYLPGPDGVVGTREFDPSLPQGQQETDWVYHYDHLGSIDVITPFGSTAVATNSSGQPGQYSEDAWGQRRNPSTWVGAPTGTDTGGFNGLTPRGFTGHEMLDNLGLVHMNGRIYDPLIGRFLSPDIVVQFPGLLQSYNRYSYVENNPLTRFDPTGWYSVLGLEFTDGGGVGGFFKDLGGYGKDAVMGGVGDNMVAGYKAGESHMETAFTEIGNAHSGLDVTIGVLGAVASVGDAAGVVLTVTPEGKAEKLATEGAERLATKAESAVTQAVDKAEGKAATIEKRVEGVATGADSTVSKAAPTTEIEATKRGPKPKGEGPHNQTIERRIQEKQKELGSDWQHVGGGSKTEVTIKTPGGTKQSRRMDITFENKKTKEVLHENVGRTKANGAPVTREDKAMDDVEKATGKRPAFTPYDR